MQQNFPVLIDIPKLTSQIVEEVKSMKLTFNDIAVLILAVIISRYGKPVEKKLPRKDFSKKTCRIVLKRQLHRCNDCKSFSEYLEFHHKDGNSANNDITNAEALCPLCHAKKTRKKLI